MLELIKFELYKIVSKPIVKIAGAFLLIYLISIPIANYVNNRVTYGNEFRSIATQFEGGQYSEEQLAKNIESIEIKKRNKEELTKKESFIYEELSVTYPEKKDLRYDVLGRKDS